MKYIGNILILISLLTSCGEGEPILENEELIFSNSYPIRIPSYEYTDPISNEVYHINGDTSYYFSYPDTISSKPEFKWVSFNYRILSMAIFTSPIKVAEGEIENVNDIIWQWHNGTIFDKADTIVQYSEGRNVINGIIDYDSDPIPLENAHYYWAVWGWGSSGTRILYSSRPLEFYVLNQVIDNK